MNCSIALSYECACPIRRARSRCASKMNSDRIPLSTYLTCFAVFVLDLMAWAGIIGMVIGLWTLISR